MWSSRLNTRAQPECFISEDHIGWVCLSDLEDWRTDGLTKDCCENENKCNLTFSWLGRVAFPGCGIVFRGSGTVFLGSETVFLGSSVFPGSGTVFPGTDWLKGFVLLNLSKGPFYNFWSFKWNGSPLPRPLTSLLKPWTSYTQFSFMKRSNHVQFNSSLSIFYQTISLFQENFLCLIYYTY